MDHPEYGDDDRGLAMELIFKDRAGDDIDPFVNRRQDCGADFIARRLWFYQYAGRRVYAVIIKAVPAGAGWLVHRTTHAAFYGK